MMLARLRKALPVHPTLRDPRTGAPLRAIGFVGGKALWPVMGGAPDDDGKGGDDGGSGGDGGDDKGGGADDSKAGGDGDGGSDRGFPDNTPVNEMTDKQQTAYWRHKARKHEATVKARADYDELKKRAAEADKLRKERETESEKAVREAAEKAAIEGAQVAAGQRLVGLLVARGKTEDEADEIIDDLNLARYVKDGKPDREAIAAAVERLAPPAKGDDKRRMPDLGQGRRMNAPAKGVATGRDLFEARRGNKAKTDA